MQPCTRLARWPHWPPIARGEWRHSSFGMRSRTSKFATRVDVWECGSMSSVRRESYHTKVCQLVGAEKLRGARLRSPGMHHAWRLPTFGTANLCVAGCEPCALGYGRYMERKDMRISGLHARSVAAGMYSRLVCPLHRCQLLRVIATPQPAPRAYSPPSRCELLAPPQRAPHPYYSPTIYMHQPGALLSKRWCPAAATTSERSSSPSTPHSHFAGCLYLGATACSYQTCDRGAGRDGCPYRVPYATLRSAAPAWWTVRRNLLLTST